MLQKQSLYFHTALSYSTYAVTSVSSTFLVSAGECVTLHCDSRPSLQQLKCERRSSRLVPPYHHCFHRFLMTSRKMTRTRCSSISQRSASPPLSVLHALLYETHKLVLIRHAVTPEWSQCDVMQRWSDTPGIQQLQERKKTLILNRVDELVIQRDSFHELLCNILSYQMSSINAAPLFPLMKRSYCRCDMSQMD